MSYWVDIESGDRCNFGFYYSSAMHDIHTLTQGFNQVVFTYEPYEVLKGIAYFLISYS